eukprot:366235-Chlamydomonas_euryale.AAC.3
MTLQQGIVSSRSCKETGHRQQQVVQGSRASSATGHRQQQVVQSNRASSAAGCEGQQGARRKAKYVCGSSTIRCRQVGSDAQHPANGDDPLLSCLHL